MVPIMGCLRCKATPWGVYGTDKGLKMMLEYLKEQENDRKKPNQKK